MVYTSTSLPPKRISGRHKFEKPDFIINNDGLKFGVEVTEYYQDLTSGNYANIPEYMSSILADESNIMKKDRGKLYKAQVGFNIGGMPTYARPMVFREFLSPQKRLERLDEIIEAKVQALKGYDVSKLDFVDLVIHDQGDLFGGDGGCEIQKYLRELSLLPIADLPYKRVYICKKIGVFEEPIVLRSKPGSIG